MPGVEQMLQEITVLGLDLSLRGTGMCVLRQDAVSLGRVIRECKTFGIPLKESATAWEQADRLERLWNSILMIVHNFQVTHVGIENYAFSRAGQQTRLAELGGVVRVELYRRKIPFEVVSVTAARKFLFGDGAKKKPDAQKALKARGLMFDTEHEADAFVIASFVWGSTLGMPVNFI